jgi:RHS repeat-associated protein
VSNQIDRNLKNSIKEILEVNEDNEYKAIKSNKEKVNIAYDDNGNIIEYKNKKYIFDFLNRLIALKDSNNNEIARYYYDAQNRRVEKLINNITTTYLYQNNQVVQERVNGITTNTYYYGEYLDDPIAYSFDEQIYYYLKDNNYSVMSIINKNAKVVESYSYTPFGKMSIKDQKGQVLLQSKINNTITYTGRRLDKESNLYYYRNRMYDPELGRFLSKDPKGYVDGMNLYAYVKNNPVRYLDPMGTTAQSSNNYFNFATDFASTFEDTYEAAKNIPSIFVNISLSIGDYLAKVSGFRDWQNPSVMDINIAQQEVISDTKSFVIDTLISTSNTYDKYTSVSGITSAFNDAKSFMTQRPGIVVGEAVQMAIPLPLKTAKVVGKTSTIIDDVSTIIRSGVGDGRTHIAYEGIKNGKPYLGYASKPGTNNTFKDVLSYRYGNNFKQFDRKPIERYLGTNQSGKDISRGLEHRLFEARGKLTGTSNQQNPVGINNKNREYYLDAADKYLKQLK